MEFYHKYRPKTLGGMVGQAGAISSIQKLIEKKTIPHIILLTGPSGTGKTTIGRILKTILACDDTDYQEIDCATVESPMDTVRLIRRGAQMRPMGGECRIFFLEEVQSLSRATFSQQGLLKLLEDAPAHAYFILATTDPGKLNKAIMTRCFEIKLSSLGSKDLEKLMHRVIEKEKLEVSADVLAEIIEAAGGSARKALVILEQVGSLEGEDAQINAIQSTTVDKDLAITLARELINPKVQWNKVAPILKELKDEPEGIRYLVLGYARSVMLGGGPLASRAFMIIDIFSANFYDSKAAGLAAACWEVVHPAR